MNDPLRVCVIGAGPAAGELHLPQLARLQKEGRIVLSCVCDLDHKRGEQAKTAFGFAKVRGDAHAALSEPDIDIVYIFGNAQTHAALGRAALEAGKHLFVEKPIAPSYADAISLADIARRKNRIAVGGHNRRFHASLERVRTLGGTGGWRFASVNFHKPAVRQPVPFGAASWLTANGIHALDALLWIMGGPPHQLMSSARDEIFTAMLQWDDGREALFSCNNQAGIRQEEYAFHAPGLSVRVDDGNIMVATAQTVTRESPTVPDNGMRAEHDAFLDAIATGQPPRHSLEALSPSLKLAELIEAGFRGEVELQAEATSCLTVMRKKPGGILVLEPRVLMPAIARHLPAHALVALEEITAPRPDITAMLVGGGSRPLPAHLLELLPNLAILGIVALSLERYDPEPFLARGVTVINASQTYADSVAEFALGLAVLGRRRAFVSDTAMRAGGWGTALPLRGMHGAMRHMARGLRPLLDHAGATRHLLPIWQNMVPPLPRGVARDLAGARVGLIGWGANARAFGRRLIAANAHVTASSEHASASDIAAAGATPASLADVLGCEIVSLHRALTPATRHAIGATELARLQSGTLLINVARGALIEPRALLARLKQGDIFACLDTFETEPPARGDPLRRLSNVFLTSHIAGGSPDMHAAAADEVVRKVAVHPTVRSI